MRRRVCCTSVLRTSRLHQVASGPPAATPLSLAVRRRVLRAVPPDRRRCRRRRRGGRWARSAPPARPFAECAIHRCRDPTDRGRVLVQHDRSHRPHLVACPFALSSAPSMSIRVALLKMNIEGGERHVLKEIDLSIVDRVIVSSHDFRAELGHGEHFRADVLNILDAAGFTCTPWATAAGGPTGSTRRPSAAACARRRRSPLPPTGRSGAGVVVGVKGLEPPASTV